MEMLAFQISGAIIILILLVFSLTQKRVSLISNFFYFVIYGFAILTLVFEALTYFGVFYWFERAPSLTEIFFKTYLVSILGSVWSVQMYVLNSFKENKTRKIVSYISSAIAIMIAVNIYMGNARLVAGGVEGAITDITLCYIHAFVTSVFICIVTIILNAIFHKDIRRNRNVSLTVWLIIIMFACIVQSFFPKLMISGFIGAVGIVILYTRLENPDFQKDLASGAYTYTTMVEYLDELIKEGKHFTAVMIHNPKMKIISNGSLEEYFAVSKVLDIINKFKSGKLFLTLDNELIFITTRKEEYYALKDELSKLEEEFFAKEKTTDEREALEYIIYESSQDDVLSTDLYECFNYALVNRDTMDDSNEIYVSSEVIFEYKRSKKVERILENSIANEAIEIFYQPIYGNAKKRFVSVEALCRIREENGRFIPPDYFINMAEKNGSIIKLGKIIFKKCCRFIAENHLERYGVEHVEINLSAKQSESADLAEQLIEIMDEYKINPSLINLEVTESASIKNLRRVQKNMTALRQYGCSFSLDDYGKGEANLNYLIGLPFDIVKIDQYLVRAFFSNNRSKILIQDTIESLHKLNYQIVAEGIETKEMLNGINAIGTDYIQGYFYSRPLCEKDYIAFLKEKNGDGYDS